MDKFDSPKVMVAKPIKHQTPKPQEKKKNMRDLSVTKKSHLRAIEALKAQPMMKDVSRQKVIPSITKIKRE